jgi:hypothetical protein
LYHFDTITLERITVLHQSQHSWAPADDQVAIHLFATFEHRTTPR